MILYRISSKVHARDLSGTGASLFGGRWNSKGVPMLYTSESLSLAALEVIANLSGDKLNKNLYCVEIDFPNNLTIDEIKVLQKGWSTYPYGAETVRIGNEFVNKGGLCLRVPSAIITSESNYLLNPRHEHFDLVKILDARPLILDQRLFNV